MILTVRDGYDKREGKDLQMFSRPGKATIAQYLQFTQHKIHSSPKPKPHSDSDNSEEEHGLLSSKKNKDPISHI